SARAAYLFDFHVRKGMRHGPRRRRWELRRVGNKDLRVISVAKETEVVHRSEPAASCSGAQMLDRSRPRGECFARHVFGTARHEEAIEVPEDVFGPIAAPAQRSLERDVPREDRSDAGPERIRSSHRDTSAVGP